WIMVPIAPSRITMRSSSSASSAGKPPFGAVIGRSPSVDTEGTAHVDGELRTVQRVEMKLRDAVPAQGLHLIDRDPGAEPALRLRVVVETLEALMDPCGHLRPAPRGEVQHLPEAVDRQDARHDRRLDAGSPAAVTEAQE